MADQATLNGGSRVKIHSPLVEGVFGNIAGLTNDIATLAELQAKLAVHDLKESVERAARPAALAAGAGLLVVGGLPVLLIGLAELVANALHISHGLSLVLTAVTTFAIAGVLAWLGVPKIGRSFESFRRSSEELQRNIAWIKTVLAHSGRGSR